MNNFGYPFRYRLLQTKTYVQDINDPADHKLKATLLKHANISIEESLLVLSLYPFPLDSQYAQHPVNKVYDKLPCDGYKHPNEPSTHIPDHVHIFIAIVFEADSVTRLYRFFTGQLYRTLVYIG